MENEASGFQLAGNYAGIGARATPADLLALMREVAARLAAQNWTLRTGGAKGADQAFMEGAVSGHGSTEVYLPWPEYNGHSASRLDRPSQRAYDIAARHHPAWGSCSSAVQALHARNCHQVLGSLLDDPVTFLLCYTPDGSLNGSSRTAGGTGQALRVAASAEVPIFNLKRPEHRQRVEAWVA